MHPSAQFAPKSCVCDANESVQYLPILVGVKNLLQHGREHPFRGKLRDLDPPIGELFLHVGQPYPYFLELGVLDVARLVGIVLAEHLLLF